MNIELVQHEFMPTFEKVRNITFPIMWAEEVRRVEFYVHPEIRQKNLSLFTHAFVFEAQRNYDSEQKENAIHSLFCHFIFITIIFILFTVGGTYR